LSPNHQIAISQGTIEQDIDQGARRPARQVRVGLNLASRVTSFLASTRISFLAMLTDAVENHLVPCFLASAASLFYGGFCGSDWYQWSRSNPIEQK
jgi:hypothetical protein